MCVELAQTPVSASLKKDHPGTPAYPLPLYSPSNDANPAFTDLHYLPIYVRRNFKILKILMNLVRCMIINQTPLW